MRLIFPCLILFLGFSRKNWLLCVSHQYLHAPKSLFLQESLNSILVVTLIILGQQLFALKTVISEQLITGLSNNFQAMDEASIRQTILVDDTIPVQFDLPVVTETWVTLTEPTYIQNAKVIINTGFININAPANITLPKGTRLPIALNITVPVNATVPVHLEVPVDIPLSQTELHDPFVGLQGVVEPYDLMLDKAPNKWEDTPFCKGDFGFLCSWFLIP